MTFVKHQFPTVIAQHFFAPVTAVVVHIKIICVCKYEIKTMISSVCIVRRASLVKKLLIL
jgi:hypothetical protein